MKTVRWSLTILTMALTFWAVSGFYLAVRQSEVLRYIVKVKFDVPKGTSVRINGKEMASNPVGLDHRHEYTISFYREGVLVKEIRYTPSERDRNIVKCD